MDKEKIKISRKELKMIMDEYTPNPDKDDDDMLLFKEAVQCLNTSDRIIFLIYTDVASEQKVADLLGVSRTPVHGLITRCREQINNYVKKHKQDGRDLERHRGI